MTYQVVRSPAAVREILSRPADFPPKNALTAVVPLAPQALRILNRVGFALPPVLASAGGELHMRVRRVVARFFTPAKVAAIGPRVARLTAQHAAIVNETLDAGPVDLAAAIAQPVPAEIMRELTGIDCPDIRLLKQWSRDSLELFWGWPSPERQLELAGSAAEFYSWLRAQVCAARGEPSLLGALHAAGLTVPQICSLGYFLVIAGQETTSQLMCIGLYRALADHQRWQALCAGGSAQDFVRNLLATESSVPTWRRISEHDAQVGDVHFPAGAEILLELTGHHSADATAYTLAFGYGLHRCLGAKLAELETTLVLETAARTLDPVVLAGAEPEWMRLLSFQSPRTVTVSRRNS